jgi:hypothetical protein
MGVTSLDRELMSIFAAIRETFKVWRPIRYNTKRRGPRVRANQI